jgi:hypothetical protein
VSGNPCIGVECVSRSVFLASKSVWAPASTGARLARRRARRVCSARPLPASRVRAAWPEWPVISSVGLSLNSNEKTKNAAPF